MYILGGGVPLSRAGKKQLATFTSLMMLTQYDCWKQIWNTNQQDTATVEIRRDLCANLNSKGIPRRRHKRHKLMMAASRTNDTLSTYNPTDLTGSLRERVLSLLPNRGHSGKVSGLLCSGRGCRILRQQWNLSFQLQALREKKKLK